MEKLSEPRWVSINYENSTARWWLFLWSVTAIKFYLQGIEVGADESKAEQEREREGGREIGRVGEGKSERPTKQKINARNVVSSINVSTENHNAISKMRAPNYEEIRDVRLPI